MYEKELRMREGQETKTRCSVMDLKKEHKKSDWLPTHAAMVVFDSKLYFILRFTDLNDYDNEDFEIVEAKEV